MTNSELKEFIRHFLFFSLASASIIFAGYGFEPFTDFKKIALLIGLSLVVAIINVKFKKSISLPIIVIGLFLLAILTYTMTKNHDLFTNVYRWILFGVVSIFALRQHQKKS